MLTMTTGNRTHVKSKRGNDLYETPEVGTRAALHKLKVPKRLWECCAGRNAMVDELRRQGHEVVATELARYRNVPSSGAASTSYGVDFLKQTAMPDGVDAIFTNPPFKNAEEFLQHALVLSNEVFFLMRVGFIAGLRWRSDEYGFARHCKGIHVFSPRLPMMHRDGFRGERNENSALDLAFYHFVRDCRAHEADPMPPVGWLNWHDTATKEEEEHYYELRRAARQTAKRKAARGVAKLKRELANV
jgi:hypothetical protein